MVSDIIVAKTKKAVKGFAEPFIRIIAKTGISPAVLTLFSFLFGIASVYFLFENQALFIVFSLLAILFDIIDGSLARHLNKESKLGFWLDQGNDRLVNFLMLLKYNIVFESYWIVLPLYIIHYLLFFVFKTKNVIYTRTVLVGFFVFGYFDLFGYNGFELGMIATILLLLLGILLQIIEFARRK